MMKLLKLLLSLLLINSAARAGGFDDLGYSARAVGFGGAGVSIHGTPYSLFYNPAAIYSCKNFSFYTTYSNLFPGLDDDKITYLTAAGIVPVGFIGSLGAGVTFLNSDLWKEYTLQGTYAKELFGGFTVGASFKYLGWSAAAAEGESALSYNGITFDAGVLYSLVDLATNSELTFGLAIQNITEPSTSSSGNAGVLPRKIVGGINYRSTKYNYMVTSDVILEEKDYYYRGGAEFLAYKDVLFSMPIEVFFRAGYYSVLKSEFVEANGLNGGFGIQLRDYTLDYAYNYPHLIEQFGGNHKISFSFNF